MPFEMPSTSSLAVKCSQQHHSTTPTEITGISDYRDHQQTYDPWNDGEEAWAEQEEYLADQQELPAVASNTTTGKRFLDAWTSGVQTALWWLRHQRGRRPILTTVAVTLVAGITGFVAGPAIAAGVGVLASVASLLLTSDAIRSAAELVAG
jgi:hypothetical protein